MNEAKSLRNPAIFTKIDCGYCGEKKSLLQKIIIFFRKSKGKCSYCDGSGYVFEYRIRYTKTELLKYFGK